MHQEPTRYLCRALLAPSTLQFLKNEEFIRCGNAGGQGMLGSNVVLTSKGLAILNSTPDILIEKISGDKRGVVWVENNIIQNDSNKIVFYSSNREEHELIKNGHQIEINVEVSDVKEDADGEIHEKSEMRIIKKFIKVDANEKQILVVGLHGF